MACDKNHSFQWLASMLCLLTICACTPRADNDPFDKAIYQSNAENEVGSVLTPRGVILP